MVAGCATTTPPLARRLEAEAVAARKQRKTTTRTGITAQITILMTITATIQPARGQSDVLHLFFP